MFSHNITFVVVDRYIHSSDNYHLAETRFIIINDFGLGTENNIPRIDQLRTSKVRGGECGNIPKVLLYSIYIGNAVRYLEI